jgi:hypothetical protein
MVSISSFMLPAVEIAWRQAESVAALLPLIAAVAVPMAAGEEPLRGRVEEEAIFWKICEGKRKCSVVRVGRKPVLVLLGKKCW